MLVPEVFPSPSVTDSLFKAMESIGILYKKMMAIIEHLKFEGLSECLKIIWDGCIALLKWFREIIYYFFPFLKTWFNPEEKKDEETHRCNYDCGCQIVNPEERPIFQEEQKKKREQEEKKRRRVHGNDRLDCIIKCSKGSGPVPIKSSLGHLIMDCPSRHPVPEEKKIESKEEAVNEKSAVTIDDVSSDDELSESEKLLQTVISEVESSLIIPKCSAECVAPKPCAGSSSTSDESKPVNVPVVSTSMSRPSVIDTPPKPATMTENMESKQTDSQQELNLEDALGLLRGLSMISGASRHNGQGSSSSSSETMTAEQRRIQETMELLRSFGQLMK